MSRAGDDGLSISDDDLIEVQVTRASSTTSNRPPRSSIFDNLLNPRGVASRARAVMTTLALPMGGGGARPAGNHSRRSQQPGGSSQASHIRLRPPHSHSQSILPRSWSTTPVPDSAIIDLTAEPDSPVERRRTQPTQAPQAPQQPQPYNPARNPRRTNSQRISPPQLSRSDSTFIGPQPSFIDLTADSPEDEQRANREFWRQSRAHRQHTRRHHRGHEHIAQQTHDHLVSLGLISHHHQQSLQAGFDRDFPRRWAGFFNGEIVTGSFGPVLSQEDPSPKSPMEPIPPTRTGFTRNTCADNKSEQVVICPACNEELAYDPTESPATPSKKRKKASGEHHFWALKKCGHVYCADCFENRRPTKTSPDGVGFPFPPGTKLTATPNDIRCAVEGCDTKVAAKQEWVGIFL
ncbi:hypothetical protein ACHAQJ_002924 [Trichoderma viride]